MGDCGHVQVDVDMVDRDNVFSLHALNDGGQTVRSADGLYQCSCYWVYLLCGVVVQLRLGSECCLLFDMASRQGHIRLCLQL